MYIYVIHSLVTKEEFTTVGARTFTIGEPIQYFYQNPLVPIFAIRWGVDPGDEGDIDREFSNPVSVNDVFNRFGSGVFQLSCFYRQSPVTLEGSFSLSMRGNSVDSFSIIFDILIHLSIR